MKLAVLPGTFAIVRLSPSRKIPRWAWRNRTFLSLTYTAEELSIVCEGLSIPGDITCENGWVAIKVLGPLDFSLTGVLASLTVPLATQAIPIFAISTFDTDYLLVKEHHLSPAKEALEQVGHTFV